MRSVPGGAGSRCPVVARIHRESELATMRDFNTAGPVRPDWHYCLPLDERDVFEAREALILRRETHLDQLTDKLREPRVRRVIEPLLSGGDGGATETDGCSQTIDKGLEQTAAYMDTSGADAGRLVVFDMHEGTSWEDRVFREEARARWKADHRLGGLTPRLRIHHRPLPSVSLVDLSLRLATLLLLRQVEVAENTGTDAHHPNFAGYIMRNARVINRGIAAAVVDAAGNGQRARTE